MQSRNICVIPARGGSTRIPKKNIADLFGKPLLAYTIEAALDAELFGDNIYVSSDSEEILAHAVAYPGVQRIVRPAALARDDASLEDVCLHVLESLPDKEFESLALLMPNCPLRTNEEVVASHKLFLAADAKCVMSVIDYHWLYPFWALEEKDERLKFFFGNQYLLDSKKLPQNIYCPSGAIRWIGVDYLKKEKKFYGVELMKYKIPFERGIDIDTYDDLALAKKFFPLVYRSVDKRR